MKRITMPLPGYASRLPHCLSVSVRDMIVHQIVILGDILDVCCACLVSVQTGLS